MAQAQPLERLSELVTLSDHLSQQASLSTIRRYITAYIPILFATTWLLVVFVVLWTAGLVNRTALANNQWLVQLANQCGR